MPKEKKMVEKATFRLSVVPEGDRRRRVLNVERRMRTIVPSQLRDCHVGDERRCWQDMQHWGVEYYFATLPSDGGAVRIEWYEYQDDDGRWRSCTPDVDAGDQFSEIQSGLELLQKIGETVERRIGHVNRKPTDASFAEPDVVLAALRNSPKFVEVERFKREHRGYWLETVPALSEIGA